MSLGIFILCIAMFFVGMAVANLFRGETGDNDNTWKSAALKWKKAHANAWCAYENARQLLERIDPSLVRGWVKGTIIKNDDHITLP